MKPLRFVLILMVLAFLPGCFNTTPQNKIKTATGIALNHAYLHQEQLQEQCAQGNDRACELSEKLARWISLGERFKAIADGQLTDDLRQNALIVLDQVILELQASDSDPLLTLAAMDIKTIIEGLTE